MHYPTFLVEIAVTNEHRGRLVADADLKYFHVNTTNYAWLGVKVDEQFLGRVRAESASG